MGTLLLTLISYVQEPATEVFICGWDSDGDHSCELISRPEKVVYDDKIEWLSDGYEEDQEYHPN